MARMNAEKLRQIYIDQAPMMVPESARITDLVPANVLAVSTVERDGSTRLLGRGQFNQSLPANFTTHLTHVEKG